MPEGVYTLCKTGGAEVAGMMEMTPGAGFDGAPDHWFTYIEVDDVDARAARAADAGGEVTRMAPFKWVNTMLGNIKSAPGRTYRKRGPNHAERYLTNFT